jgi:NAD(P)-dependent dehydrogenase (short-subunit alcohol dehydrogenase family)
MSRKLDGKVALVAGATRGAGRGIAVELGAAGAIVYATGRTTRAQRSEYNRPETIEETAELVEQAGGRGIAVPLDLLDPAQVQALAARIEREQGRLDVLVNDAGARTSSRSGTSPSGSIRWRRACACCASPWTRTSSPATSRSRS